MNVGFESYFKKCHLIQTKINYNSLYAHSISIPWWKICKEIIILDSLNTQLITGKKNQPIKDSVVIKKTSAKNLDIDNIWTQKKVCVFVITQVFVSGALFDFWKTYSLWPFEYCQHKTQ